MNMDGLSGVERKIRRESYMNASVLLSMAGGLGLFLFGMCVMSDSIEKVAGAKLRHILEIFTTNRFTGMIVGVPLMALIYDLVRQLTYRGVRMRGKDDMLDAYRAAYHPKEKK